MWQAIRPGQAHGRGGLVQEQRDRQRLFSYPLGYEAEESSQVAIWEGMLFFSGNGGTCDLYALALLDEKLFLPLLLREQ